MLEPSITVALIIAIPGTLAVVSSATFGYLNYRSGQRQEVKLHSVGQEMDGIKTELVESTRKGAFAAGIKQEQDYPEKK